MRFAVLRDSIIDYLFTLVPTRMVAKLIHLDVFEKLKYFNSDELLEWTG